MATVTPNPNRVDPLACLLDQAARRPQATALEILETGERMSYGRLLSAVASRRASLIQHGVGKGDFVLVMLPSGIELVVSIYALMSLSAVAVPVSRSLTDFELGPVLHDARPVGVITSGTSSQRPLLRESLSLRFILDTETEETRPAPIDLSIPSADTVVSCHFTYKGFGYPLGTLHQYDHYAASVAGAAACYVHEEGSTHLTVLPQYPVYGLSCTLTPLSMGCHLLVSTAPESLDLLSVLRERQVRIVGVVPLLYRSLVQRAQQLRKQGVSLDLHPELEIACGGSYLPRELSEHGEEVLGFAPSQGYGLSETLLVSTNRHGAQRHGTLGKSMHPDTQIRIVDAHGEGVPPGRVGEIVITGPTVTSGYVRRPRETARHLKQGRFFTGDLGHFDRDGFLCFDGRSQPFTKAASQMVDLTEIERVLSLHPAVAQAMATVRFEPRTGERISASVIFHRGTQVDARELKRHCARFLSPHKLPRHFELLQRELRSFGQASA